MKIDENDLGKKYPEIGKGIESTIYKYSCYIAVKIFNKEEINLDNITERIKYLANFKVKNVVFPISLVFNFKNEFIGYTMKLITFNNYKSFFNLWECKDNTEFINYFIKAKEILKELHSNKIYVGDFNPNNIMIKENKEPVFIDTINYATPEFNFLYEPFSAKIHEKIFKRKCSYENNDKFMFAFLFMSYFIPFNRLKKAINNPNYFYEIINGFPITQSSKNTLMTIFSPNPNKEYIDNVLKDFKKIDYPKQDNKFGKLIKMIFQ